MTAVALIELQANLKALNLSSMARNLEGLLRQAKETGIDYDEFLLDLTGAELQARAESRLNRRIKESRFPLLKPIETFDLAAVPDLDIRLFRDLAGGGYIQEHRNIIFLGRSGTGKTHMATALGIEACGKTFGPVLSLATGWSMNWSKQDRREHCSALSKNTFAAICWSWTNWATSRFPRKDPSCCFRFWRNGTRKDR